MRAPGGEKEVQMALDYRKCAEEIVANIGGRENVVSAAHCATRLRLVIKDNNKLNGMTWYTFRHNAGTRLYYIPGLSNKLKASIMGHTEEIFLSVYSHLDEQNENLDILRQISL